jgi:cell division initiation protein
MPSGSEWRPAAGGRAAAGNPAAEGRREGVASLLTPLDIHNKEFHRGMRGYREDEVDDFLDQVVADFEALLKENATLKDQVADLQQRLDQYRQLESTLHSTLIVAQETADAVKESARKEAELIVQEAEARAQAIRDREAAEVKRAQEQLAELNRRTIAFRAQVRSLLESQLELLRREEQVIEAAASREA